MRRFECTCNCCKIHKTTMRLMFEKFNIDKDDIDINGELETLREAISIIAEGKCAPTLAAMFCKKTLEKVEEKSWRN